MFSVYFTAFAAMVVVIVLSSTALHLARYKRRGVGCCSDGIETGGSGVHGCKTCKCRGEQA